MSDIERAREVLERDIELYVRRRGNCQGLSEQRWQKGIQYWRITRAIRELEEALGD